MIFSKKKNSKISFRNTLRVSYRLDPDQGRRSVDPDLVLICLQWLSADDTSTCTVGKKITQFIHAKNRLKLRDVDIVISPSIFHAVLANVRNSFVFQYHCAEIR